MHIPPLHFLLSAIALTCASVTFASAQTTTTTPAATPLRVVIIGDSTVMTYQASDPKRGWGQYFADSFNSSVTVFNHAMGGRSTKTFLAEGRWAKALADKPDIILIQFGHNDAHGKNQPESTDAQTDYMDNLRRYVNEARAASATPILVTPPHRRVFNNAQLTRELEPYAKAMRQVASELSVPLVDLYTQTGELFVQLGEEGSAAYTTNLNLNVDVPGSSDRSHFTEKGARELAKIVARDSAALEPRLKAALRPTDS